MQLEYLKYLIEIKEYGSMNKAAEHLFVSQQNISKAIRGMEAEIGCKIFEKDSKRSIFTKEGMELYRFALKYREEREKLFNQLTEQYLENITGSVTIGAMRSAASMILPQMLVKYYVDYPNISLNIVEGSSTEIISMVEKKEISLALGILGETDKVKFECMPELINCTILGECRGVFWVSKLNPLAKKKEISFKDIIQEPVVLHTQSDIQLLQKIYKNWGKDMDIVMQSKNPYILGTFVSDNFGVLPDVALLNGQCLMHYIFEGNDGVVPIPVVDVDGYRNQICLWTNRNSEMSILEKNIIHFILNKKWEE